MYVTKFCLQKDYPRSDFGVLLLFSAAISSVFPSVTSMSLLCLLSCQWHHCCFLRWRLFYILQGWQVGMVGKPWASEDTQVCSQQRLLWEAQAWTD